MRTIALVNISIAALTTATLTALGVGPTPAFAAPPPMTLSSTSGPSGGGNPITAGVSAGQLAFPAGTSPTVQFQYNGAGATACSAMAQDVTQIDGTASALTDGVLTVDPDYVRRLSTTKIAFTVPSSSYPASGINPDGLSLLPGQTTSKWNVCVYTSESTTTSTLIATASYTLALRPIITAILPARGSALGGQTITVNGAGFSTGTTASIDGAALSNVTLNAAGDSFTATSPAHDAGTGYSLVVKTAGGLVSSSDPDNNGLPKDNDDDTPDAPIPFTFDNSIVVSPNLAATGSSTDIDVRGTGFNDLVFDLSGNGVPTDDSAHVFLVSNVYDADTNRGVQECQEVLVVDDTEIICRLDLASDSLDPVTSAARPGIPVGGGTYTLTVVADGSTTATLDEVKATMVTSGSTFTVAPY